MEYLTPKRIIKTVVALVLIGISVSLAFGIADSIASMHGFDAQDKAGETDAALGSILLIPLVVGMALAAAVSTFFAIVLIASAFIGRIPDDAAGRGVYRQRITGLAVVAIVILGGAILAVGLMMSSDTDVIWIVPGILLFGLLVFIWTAITLAKVRVVQKLTNITAPSQRIV